MARSENKKCSGTRIEVSGSRVAGRGGVGKGDDMGAKKHCYVHRCLYCDSKGVREHFPAVI